MASTTVTCRNCGEPAGPEFCGFCGQAIDDRRHPLLALIRELIDEALSLDSRSLRTLRTLPRPGRLTRLYLDGQRIRFLPPFRLYLLASVVLFSSAFTLEPPDASAVNFYIAGELMTGSAPVPGRPNVTFMDPDSAAQRWLTTVYAENFARLKAKPPQEALNTMFRGLRSVLPIALIAFLPVFALALKLLYVRRHVLYVDHLIFAAHFQSALFFMFAVVWLVARVAQLALAWTMLLQIVVFLLMATVYLGMALRRLHEESRAMTAAKSIIVLFAYLFGLQWTLGPALVFVISRI